MPTFNTRLVSVSANGTQIVAVDGTICIPSELMPAVKDLITCGWLTPAQTVDIEQPPTPEPAPAVAPNTADEARPDEVHADEAHTDEVRTHRLRRKKDA